MKVFRWIIVIFIGLLVMTLIYLIGILGKGYFDNVYTKVLLSNNSGDWGAFGDFVGGILNPIFGLISVTLILVTIWQQNKGLAQTTKQINLSFEEMTKSVAAQEKQAELSEKQLNELMKKTILDDSVRVLNNLILDLNSSTNEFLVCYKNHSIKRDLKSQLLELSKTHDQEQKSDFLKCNSYAYEHFLDTYKYVNTVLEQLKLQDEGITYDYYRNKLDVFKKLLIKEGGNVQAIR